MLHPLFSTLVQRPDLVVDHLSAYASLLAQETRSAGAEVIDRVVAWVLALVCTSVFLVLSGVAVMLGVTQSRFHWVLVTVPAFMLLLAIVAFAKAKKPLPAHHFPLMKEQIDSDARALRAANE